MSHRFVREVLHEGDWVVDATIGNGHDTAWLAVCVGTSGKVFGFDIQEDALRQTRSRLNEEGLSRRVALFSSSHEDMKDCLPDDAIGRIQAITFNLGYLPGGDKTIITTAASTCIALEQAGTLLVVGGVMTIVVYTGHPGGEEESYVVRDWAAALHQRNWRVNKYCSETQRNNPPYLLRIERLQG